MVYKVVGRVKTRTGLLDYKSNILPTISCCIFYLCLYSLFCYLNCSSFGYWELSSGSYDPLIHSFGTIVNFFSFINFLLSAMMWCSRLYLQFWEGFKKKKKVLLASLSLTMEWVSKLLFKLIGVWSRVFLYLGYVSTFLIFW